MKTTKKQFIELMGNDINILSPQGVDKLCSIIDKIAEEKAKNCNLSHVSVVVAVEEILKPKYMNDTYTWKQIQDAINKATER